MIEILHLHGESLREIIHKLNHLLKQGEKIMATQADLTVQLKAATEQIAKIGTETTTLLQKIDDLLNEIANAPVSPELQAAADALSAQAQVVDDLVPDATPPTP